MNRIPSMCASIGTSDLELVLGHRTVYEGEHPTLPFECEVVVYNDYVIVLLKVGTQRRSEILDRNVLRRLVQGCMPLVANQAIISWLREI